MNWIGAWCFTLRLKRNFENQKTSRKEIRRTRPMYSRTFFASSERNKCQRAPGRSPLRKRCSWASSIFESRTSASTSRKFEEFVLKRKRWWFYVAFLLLYLRPVHLDLQYQHKQEHSLHPIRQYEDLLFRLFVLLDLSIDLSVRRWILHVHFPSASSDVLL